VQPARPPHLRQVEITALIWHNGQVLDLRGPSLRVRILSFEPASTARPTGAESRVHPFSETGVTTKVAVKIRLKRFGKMRAPYYRIVVADARTKRDGRAIEEIGKYHPTEEPSYIEVNSERAQYWLSVGAQPSEQVAAILKITGDWQKFKGLPGQEGTLKTKVEKESFVAPEKGSVIIPEAITKKASKSDAAEAPADAEAETTEAE
jgi:small subunit ribosomal protein S16